MIKLLISLNTQDLTVAQQRILKEELEQSVHKYRRHQDLSSLPVDSTVARLTEFLKKAYEVAVMMVKTGSLIITVQCLTLESLESLWNDYCSGYLNDIVERFLVTDEIKRKLGMDNVRLKTTIEEENYLICKKAFMENSGKWDSLSRAFFGNMYFGLISFMEQFFSVSNISNEQIKWIVTGYYNKILFFETFNISERAFSAKIQLNQVAIVAVYNDNCCKFMLR